MDEVTGLDEWIADLERAQSQALPEAEAIVAKGAVNVKKSAARRVAGLAHAPAYPHAIGFDLFHLPGSAQARIGPDKGARQGALGNILEYGTSKNAPVPHLAPALDEEAPRLVQALADLGERLLET